MEDFVTFEMAKRLKEKGFNQKCLAYDELEEGSYILTIK